MKIYKYIVVGFLYFALLSNANSFLSDDLSADLYLNIDSGLKDLEFKMYEHELLGNEDNIGQSINVLIDEDCVSKDIEAEDISKIALGNVEILMDSFEEECLDEDGNISLEKLDKIQRLIEKTYYNAISNGEKKSKFIYQLSKIGLYSDGNIQNSSFDLVADLDEINKVIFIEKITYNGEHSKKLFDFDKITDKFLKGKINKYNNDEEDEIDEQLENNNEEIDLDIIPLPNSFSQGNSYACSTDYNTSGLDSSSINAITGGLERNYDDESNNNEDNNDDEYDDLPETDYQKSNDNSQLPCDDFFCINIKFKMYEHELLGSSRDSFSIEYVVSKSNEHLKKFANTSLLPSEETTQVFECGICKGINLGNLFHIGFQISYKSPPIFNIEKKPDREDKTIYKSKNMLDRHYQKYGLNYSRANSLEEFLFEKEDKKIIQDTGELDFGKASDKALEFNNSLGGDIEKTILSKSINKKILYDDKEDLNRELIELDIFIKNINQYSNDVHIIIKKMDKIKTKK